MVMGGFRRTPDCPAVLTLVQPDRFYTHEHASPIELRRLDGVMDWLTGLPTRRLLVCSGVNWMDHLVAAGLPDGDRTVCRWSRAKTLKAQPRLLLSGEQGVLPEEYRGLLQEEPFSMPVGAYVDLLLRLTHAGDTVFLPIFPQPELVEVTQALDRIPV